jgi:DNA polymerase III epsilon subunit family exonuclease
MLKNDLQKPFDTSLFKRVFFPEKSAEDSGHSSFGLRSVIQSLVQPETKLVKRRLVVFDFETTGLDTASDRIIEIGAVAVNLDSGKLEEFSYLVDPGVEVSERITEVTGITTEMLRGKPPLKQVLPSFFEFVSDGILVAHNAEFDYAFLRSESDRLGIEFELPCFCTLKMARALLPELERKNLDFLADHYGLSFESRHRSIGDCKVTLEVMKNLLNDFGLHTWRDVFDYRVTKALG